MWRGPTEQVRATLLKMTPKGFPRPPGATPIRKEIGTQIHVYFFFIASQACCSGLLGRA